MSEDEEDVWCEEVGSAKEVEMHYRRWFETVTMSEMKETDTCTANFISTLLQMGLARDCEEATTMVCQSLSLNVDMPQAETRYVIVEKNDLYSKILNGQPVKLDKYRVGYKLKDKIKSAICDEMKQHTRKYERRGPKEHNDQLHTKYDKDQSKAASAEKKQGKYSLD